MKALSLYLLVAICAACGGNHFASTEELLDPETCMECHPNHYAEWAGSMHAYASNDPVFLAMNKRGQRETNGSLGDFCVNCHAPMAVKLGLTTDGLNLDDVPQKLKGVTCYFCHTVEEVQGDHNNPLLLADDDVLRGGLHDPVKNGLHRMAYSSLHDRNKRDAAKLCGSCHDIVTPAGVHLERTFQEWQDSLFANDNPRQLLTCGRCHMKGDEPGTVADFPGVPLRQPPNAPHEHTFPGIDTALTPWPDMDRQLEEIGRDLFGAVTPTLCIRPADGGYQIDYKLDNVFAGHSVPSGAGQDRRMWAEIIAYDDGDQITYQSGNIEKGTPVAQAAESDPDLWQIRDFAYDDAGDPAHMFWDVRDVDSQLLPAAVTNDPADPAYNHSVTRSFVVSGALPARITARVRIRQIALDVLDDLVDSGDLDPEIRDQVEAITVAGTSLEWTNDVGYDCVTP